MYWWRELFPPFGGVNFDLFLTKDSSTSLFLVAKNSTSNFRQNFWLGVNFSPFPQRWRSSLFKSLSDKLIILRSVVLDIFRLDFYIFSGVY